MLTRQYGWQQIKNLIYYAVGIFFKCIMYLISYHAVVYHIVVYWIVLNRIVFVIGYWSLVIGYWLLDIRSRIDIDIDSNIHMHTCIPVYSYPNVCMWYTVYKLSPPRLTTHNSRLGILMTFNPIQFNPIHIHTHTRIYIERTHFCYPHSENIKNVKNVAPHLTAHSPQLTAFTPRSSLE